eukprot:TRINITY_DN2662_c0_g1_i2.p1 TRINITY_DN2662_c0_g1~~TRINITY_DN2662_c0_g1_i2.p1  ORF type:complete len:384 (-),score=81.59 TRINITY_DN2662_c0_g1_i2:144-1295(-)
MVAEAGATFGRESYSWLARLILDDIDEAVQWCVKFYDVKLESPDFMAEVIYQTPASRKSNYSYRVSSRKKRLKEIEDALSSRQKLSAEQIENNKLEQIKIEQEASLDDKKFEASLSEKGARALVEKWRVSKTSIIFSGHREPGISLGHTGDVKLLELIWGYYEDMKHEDNINIQPVLQRALVAAIKQQGFMEFVKRIFELAKSEGLQLNSDSCLMDASKTSGTLSTIKFLLDNGSVMTQDAFDAILQNGDLDMVRWAMDNYVPALASKSSIDAAVEARNQACWKVGQWWAHFYYDGGGEGFEEEGRKQLSKEVIDRQEILERLEEVVSLRGNPPRSKSKVKGSDDDGHGGGDWIFNGFLKAYADFDKDVPADYLVEPSSCVLS